ncbi:MAG TPA: signal peptide peptidase SppA [Syntrophales bacterium]|nr:signal peptide peptidase SppA [Syntrophales bacterium]
MRKHPVIAGILLLFLVGTLTFVLIYRIAGKRLDFSMGDRVGVILVQGVLADARGIIEQIDDFDGNDSVKAVVLRVESPGGGVVPSQEIYDRLKKVKENKIVVASLGAVAASGGYYIACAADKIVANPGTVTGSIGVILQFPLFEELFRKIGIGSTTIKSGKYKDMGSPFRELTPGERAFLQGVTNDIYDQFVETVLASRNIPPSRTAEIAEGKIFTGRQALELGLVDTLGSEQDAVNLAAKLSGIEGRPAVVYGEEKKGGLLRYLLEESAQFMAREFRESFPGVEYRMPSP